MALRSTHTCGVAAMALAATLACACASAQSFPTKPIRLIVPNPPGGGTDFVARTIAARMPEVIGETVVVDNRSGAAGLVGTEVAARARPDGYTMLLVDNSFAINVSYYKNAKYSPFKDFDPLTDVADTFYVLTVNPSVPAATVPEFIALAKAQPGKIHLSSPGNGTAATFELRVTHAEDGH